MKKFSVFLLSEEIQEIQRQLRGEKEIKQVVSLSQYNIAEKISLKVELVS